MAASLTIHTSEVTVLFTTPDATLAALRVAATLGRAWHAPVRLIAQQLRMATPFRSLEESEAFRARIAAEIDTRVDLVVCVCRRIDDAARALLRRHSLVVIGGRTSWWPTREERLRRTLEAQGHFVVFVNADSE